MESFENPFRMVSSCSGAMGLYRGLARVLWVPHPWHPGGTQVSHLRAPTEGPSAPLSCFLASLVQFLPSLEHRAHISQAAKFDPSSKIYEVSGRHTLSTSDVLGGVLLL